MFLCGLLQHLEMGDIHPILSEFTEMGHGAKISLAFRNWVSVIRRDVNSMRFSDSFFTFVSVAKLQKWYALSYSMRVFLCIILKVISEKLHNRIIWWNKLWIYRCEIFWLFCFFTNVNIFHCSGLLNSTKYGIPSTWMLISEIIKCLIKMESKISCCLYTLLF